MENASKALLIAAAVLIVILLVTLGIKLLSTTGETTGHAQQVGDSITLTTKGAVDRITNSEKNESLNKTYKIIVNKQETITWVNQDIKEIKQGEEITLKFTSNSGDQWDCFVDGAEGTCYSKNIRDFFVILKNPTKDVNVNIQITDCCFVAGTQVLMNDGTTKNIEDVIEGNIVLSYNEITNKYEKNVVTGCITNINTTNLARVVLNDGTSIEMNEYHPIYTEEGWKSLTNYNGYPTLTKKDKILSVDGKFIPITSIESWREETPIITYNLSVANNHNYFVGTTPILVHNADCPT